MSTTTETPSQNVNGGGQETPGVLYRWIRPWAAKRTVFVNWSTGKGVDWDGAAGTVPKRASVDQLLHHLAPSVERVILVGPKPGGRQYNIGQWAAVTLPGWREAAGGHYLDTETSMTAWRFDGPGRRHVEIRYAEQWVKGDGFKLTPASLAAGMRLADAGIRQEFIKDRRGRRVDADWLPRLRDTPSVTGRELLRRTLPQGREYAPLPADVIDLLHRTSRQGRFALLKEPGSELPALFGYDMRFAYALGVQGVRGAGLASWDKGGPEFAGYAPGRYLCEWEVPYGWDQLGLLQSEDETWPSTPGEHGRGWVDGRELRLALDYGWDVKIRERVLFAVDDVDSRPLAQWAKKLIDVREKWIPAQSYQTAETIKIARAIIRTVVLLTIGSLQGKPYKTTRRADTSKGETVPRGVNARREAGGLFVWNELTPRPADKLDMVRPEWASQVWAVQRVKLLDTGGHANQPNTGALHIDPDALVGLRSDAIYSTADPGWEDTGAVGAFRVKGSPILTPVRCPATGDHLAPMLEGK